LTNWNQTFLLLYLTLSLYICFRFWHSGRRDLHSYDQVLNTESTRAGPSSYAPSVRLLKWTYFNAEHSFVWTLMVVLVYWSTEFPHWLQNGERNATELFINICVHGITFVIIGTDLFLSRVEIVFAHLAYTLPLSGLYVLTNLLYDKLGGGFLYQSQKTIRNGTTRESGRLSLPRHRLATLAVSTAHFVAMFLFVCVCGDCAVLKWDSWVSGAAVLGVSLLLVFVLFPAGHFVCRLRNKLSGNRSPIEGESFFTVR
jgi:hypothetical protein